jgi:PilZ domain
MDRERRIKARYPLHLNVRYQALGTVSPATAVGQTVNVSSSGVLITCSSSIREGTRVRVVLEWPTLLNGTTPLQLVTLGTVVRRQGSGLAIAFEGYQFRTAGRRANVATMPEPRRAANYGSAEVLNIPMAAKSSL